MKIVHMEMKDLRKAPEPSTQAWFSLIRDLAALFQTLMSRTEGADYWCLPG